LDRRGPRFARDTALSTDDEDRPMASAQAGVTLPPPDAPLPPPGTDAPVLTQEILGSLMRLARGDLSVRLARNFKRDVDDILALFVNLIAEELGRLLHQREEEKKRLEEGVAALSELFLGLAAGDFSVRAKRTETGDPLDVLAYLLNNTA